MDLLFFFCENRNGVNLTESILSSAKWDILAGVRSKIITADPTGVNAGWVGDQIMTTRVAATLEFENILENPISKTISDDVYEVAVHYFGNFKTKSLSVVLFNDRSQRGDGLTRALAELGIDYYLIQDGHLSFDYRSTAGRDGDQNYLYGHSRPRAIFVWGDSMVDQLHDRLNLAVDKIIVSGAIDHSSNDRFESGMSLTKPHSIPDADGLSLKVLFLDQPILDQKKAEPDAFRKGYDELAKTLMGFDLKVKPHPSSSKAHRDKLSSLFGDARLLSADELIGDNDLEDYSVIVTFFSSGYIEALKAGRPIIFVTAPGQYLSFPEVKHPLFRNVWSLRELGEVLLEYFVSGNFASNEAGVDLEYFHTTNTDAAAVIITTIATNFARKHLVQTGKERGNARIDHAPPDPRRRSGEDHGSMLRSLINRDAAPKSLVIIGDDFSLRTGVAVPILSYARHMSYAYGVSIKFIDVRQYPDLPSIIKEIGNVQWIIINSFAFVWRRDVGVPFIEWALNSKRQVFLYAHETQYTFLAASRNHPVRHADFLRIAPKIRYLCVSRQQKDFFQSLGFGPAAVVYNCIPSENTQKATREDRERKTVIMVGTVQDRKGAGLFSQVAELAAERNLPLDFVWVGARTPLLSKDTLVSPKVNWLGAKSRSEVGRQLASADIFFLSSSDDPMPLSVIEAIRAGLGVVTYEKVGSFELLKGVSGYESFSDYMPLAALDAIMRASAAEKDLDRFDEIADAFKPAMLAERIRAQTHNQ